MTRLAAFAVAAVLAAGTALADDRPSLTVAIQSMGPAGTLDSIENTGTAGRKFLPSIWEQLIAMDLTDPALPMRPGLATEWRSVSPTILEFSLRPGVVFHNGDVMTADDVVFSFSDERWGLLPEQTAAREAGQETFTRADGSTGIVPPAAVAKGRANHLPTLERVEKIDDLTVRFHLASPSLATEPRIARLNYASIISRRAFLEAASWRDVVKAPVGAGPYRVVSLDEGAEIRMVSHDAYYRGLPPLKELTFRVVPESASRVNGLLSGEYDIISDVNPDQVGLIDGADGFAAVGGPVVNVRFIAMDTANPGPLQNVKVRQALSHLIDHDTIAEVLWSGLTNTAPGLQMPSFGAMFADDVTPPAFDPARAKALLAEAGYAGEPIAYGAHNDYYPNELTVSQFVLGTMQEAGVNVDFAIMDSPNRKTPERMMANLSNTAHFAHPIAILANNCPEGGQNLKSRPDSGNWRNDEFDRLCDVLNTSTDVAEVKAANRRMQQILLQEDPAILVLHQNAIIFGKRADIDWRPSSIFAMPFGPGEIAFAGN